MKSNLEVNPGSISHVVLQRGMVNAQAADVLTDMQMDI